MKIMTEIEKQLEIPAGSSVLLDTNVLIDTTKNPESFSKFFNALSSLHIASITEQTIRFEFLRGLRDVEAGENLLQKLCGKNHLVLSSDSDIFDRALKIAGIYLKSDNKHTGIADALIAAQLSKYARENNRYPLYLATQNHKDFPPVLFHRIDEFLLTLPDGTIKVIGLYSFRKNVYDSMS